MGRAVRRHATAYQRRNIRQNHPSGVSRRLNFAERVTPTTAKSNDATARAYQAHTTRTIADMSVDCINVKAATPEAVTNVHTTVLVFMPSNVRNQRRAAAVAFARHGGSRTVRSGLRG